ncbi:MAG: tyrosine-type recombinase/integrase [Pseudomonadota bacterium]
MPRVRITRDFVRRLAAPTKETFWWDESTPGFGIRSYPSGSHFFVIQYEGSGGRTKRTKLCRVSEAVSLDQIRSRARSALADAGLARARMDPIEEKSQAIGEFVEPWLAFKKDKLKPRTWIEYERHLRVQAKPLHGIEARRLNLKQVARLLDDVREKRGQRAGDSLRSTLSSFCSWLVARGEMELNPVTGTDAEPVKVRDRVLDFDELARVWLAADPATHGGAMIRLAMLTALRRSEAGGLERDEVNLAEMQFDISGTRMKNNVAFVCPMPEAALEFVASRLGPRQYLFGRTRAYSGFSNLIESLPARSGVKNWGTHDLRRSFATHSNALGLAAPHIIEAQLHHISTDASAHKGVARHYNKARYLKERRELVETWASVLLDAVENIRGQPAAPTPIPGDRTDDSRCADR